MKCLHASDYLSLFYLKYITLSLDHFNCQSLLQAFYSKCVNVMC